MRRKEEQLKLNLLLRLHLRLIRDRFNWLHRNERVKLKINFSNNLIKQKRKRRKPVLIKLNSNKPSYARYQTSTSCRSSTKSTRKFSLLSTYPQCTCKWKLMRLTEWKKHWSRLSTIWDSKSYSLRCALWQSNRRQVTLQRILCRSKCGSSLHLVSKENFLT